MSGWFDINTIVKLQKDFINDLSGNRDATLAINTMAGNLTALSSTVNNTSVLPTLTYQNEVNDVLEREKTRLEERKQAIDSAETSQKRLVDLTANTTLRNKALNRMFVIITIAVLCYLGIRLLINYSLASEFVTDIMFIILVTGTTITLVTMYYDYERRNNMDYNMIDLGKPAQLAGNATANAASGKNLLESRFNGCVKEACCSEGSTFNEKYSICVPNLPPFDGNTDPKYPLFKYFIATKTWQDPSSCVSPFFYSLTDLSCNEPPPSETFLNMSAVNPNTPTEMVDYNLYK